MNEPNYKAINREREIKKYQFCKEQLYPVLENSNYLKKEITQDILNKLDLLKDLTIKELNSLEN